MNYNELKIGFYTSGQKILHIIFVEVVAIITLFLPCLIAASIKLPYVRMYFLFAILALIIINAVFTVELLSKKQCDHSFFLGSFWSLIAVGHAFLFITTTLIVASIAT